MEPSGAGQIFLVNTYKHCSFRGRYKYNPQSLTTLQHKRMRASFASLDPLRFENNTNETETIKFHPCATGF